MIEPPDSASVTVVVPTVGRDSLTACLAALGRCHPLPDELLVVIQGSPEPAERMVAADAPPGTRVVMDPGRGIASGTNRGLREARHPTVMVTHDDCVVDEGWAGRGAALARRYPGQIVTGRVLPGGDPARVPSCKTDPEPHNYTGTTNPSALYANNMVLPRDAVLEIGGFDERFQYAAEDSDLAYRWLQGGRGLRYEPALIVRHDDWRTEAELERLYVRYARGSGAFYGKHLRHGDLAVTRYLVRHLRAGWQGWRAGRAGRPRWADARQSVFRGLPGGLLFGLLHLGPGGARGRSGASDGHRPSV